jgi:hypothetical protein
MLLETAKILKGLVFPQWLKTIGKGAFGGGVSLEEFWLYRYYRTGTI